VGLGSGSRYAPQKTDFFTTFGTGSDFWYWASHFGTGVPNLVLGRPIWYWAGLFGTKKYFYPARDRFYRLFHAVFSKPPLKSGPDRINLCMSLTDFLGILKTAFFGLGFAELQKTWF